MILTNEFESIEMPNCVVPGCKSETKKNLPNLLPATVHKFSFPIERVLRKQWLKSIGIIQIPKSASVCQFHFLDSYFVPKEENIDKRGRPLKTPNLKKGKQKVKIQIKSYISCPRKSPLIPKIVSVTVK